ncbi:MAG: nucleotide exchange factor GrpE [Lachnospiraceae bacterium]|nr:nucleotide exchange factor GrpE [Lachnospiraceae bacterium]
MADHKAHGKATSEEKKQTKQDVREEELKNQEAEAKAEAEAAETADAKDTEATEQEDTKATEKEDTKAAEKIAALQDQVLRQMAEFDNFRKRTEKEKEQSFSNGAASVVEKLLPIIDNFERAIASRKEDTDAAYADGVEMIYKQFNTVLEGLGIKAIEAVGKEFDPSLHNAVMHIDDENYGENEVVEELQKGYTYGDTVLRHSMVKVAN